MEVGNMIAHLVNSIQFIMESFKFTIGGVTIDLFQWFCYMVLANFLIKFVNDMHGGG